MGYEVDVNRAGSTRLRQESGLATAAGIHGREGASAHYKFYELEPAIVVDVNLSNKDSTQLGVAKVRPLYSFSNVPDAQLPLAYPLDSNVKSYPLRNEIVIVAEYNGRLFYFQRLNYFNIVNHNITKPVYRQIQGQTQITQDYDQAAAGNPNLQSSVDNTNLENENKYFQPNRKVRSLLPLEGDIIYEGRFANSIRLGGTITDTTPAGKQFSGTWAIGKEIGSPIIIIRNGQPIVTKGMENTPYMENINADKSSIYLTSDQVIPFQPSSKNRKSYKGSTTSVWDGAQILMSSDRIALNAKKDGLFFFSPKTIGFSTDGTFNIDSTKLFIVNSSKINLGLSASEPIVKGNVWMKIMIKLLVALQTETHPTPSGTSGFPLNASVYSDLINELKTALSSVSSTE